MAWSVQVDGLTTVLPKRYPRSPKIPPRKDSMEVRNNEPEVALNDDRHSQANAYGPVESKSVQVIMYSR